MLDRPGNQAGSGVASDGDYVDFLAAGVRVAGAYNCAHCGYGVTVHGPLPVCPMCARETWEAASWRPFSRLKGAAGEAGQ
jgi:rubrerythrin